MNTIQDLIEGAMRQAACEAYAKQTRWNSIGSIDFAKLTREYIRRKAAGFACREDTSVYMMLAFAESKDPFANSDEWDEIKRLVDEGYCDSPSQHSALGKHAFAVRGLDAATLRREDLVDDRPLIDGARLIIMVRNDLLAQIRDEFTCVSAAKLGLDLLDKARQRARIEESYKASMEAVFEHGDTIQMRELLSPFGTYNACEPGCEPGYPYTDAVNFIDGALARVRIALAARE